MRRAFAQLPQRPEYVLTDGFRVDGLGVPGLAVWKGDQRADTHGAAAEHRRQPAGPDWRRDHASDAQPHRVGGELVHLRRRRVGLANHCVQPGCELAAGHAVRFPAFGFTRIGPVVEQGARVSPSGKEMTKMVP